MKNEKTLKRTAALVSMTLLVASCAAPQGGGGSGQMGAAGTGNEDPCSVGKSAAAGALAGALLGAMIGGKNSAVKGAALGAAAGAIACVGINVQSRQTKTAAQADQDYQRSRGALPSQPTVVSYRSFVAAPTVVRGQQLKVNSAVELVNGTNQKIQSVREELVMIDPDGVQLQKDPKSKEFNVNAGGGYENSFVVNIPPGMSQGAYALKTNLYINGQPAGTRDLRTQIVWDGSTSTIVATR